ncbi:DUF4833 domain-containing protein [Mucilaginibacter sp. HMF5004]|uniref:DUF4833 domain-containing protein n=1 Tax=Mucilaginibacter rivuli TaxID=2857527 RepID=UPI001C5FB2EB|nr:DUF4833 domain-containing protein [Mucilaginibacter rivuli]MBW4889252.1 DUF4833 domain-containing protein [Mucilaginibacter rivuli]
MTLAFSILMQLLLFLPGNSIANKSTVNTLGSNTDTILRKVKPKIVFPTPTVPRLFYIQRDPNSNTIIYDLNTDKAGNIDKDEPVHVYWVKYNERGQKEELNFIQRKFAYGISTKPIGNDKFDVRIVAYKKYPLVLRKGDSDNKFHIFANIEKKEAMVSRIFLRIEGGSFWFPNVVYIEVKGTDPATGKELTERFKP